MKKSFIVSTVSFLFLLICSSVAYLLRYIPLKNPWWALAIGLITLAVSGIAAAFAHRIVGLNITCFLISAAALGFCIRAWYLFRGFDNPLWIMALVSFAAVIYLWIFYFLSKIPIFEKYPKIFVCIFLLLSLVGYLAVMLTTKTTYVSTFGYYMIIEIAFIFAMCSDISDIPDLIRKLTLSTYSVFAVAVFIAVIMLLGALGGDADCDCDLALDCCDLDLGGGKQKKKK